jgi:mannose-6-phosphate isomerase-like protein (cupin superfamily)
VAVMRTESDTMIGFATLTHSELAPNDGEAELVYVLDKAHWGKGYGRELARGLIRHGFDAGHLRRIVATVDAGNTASVRILEGLGFRQTGSEAGYSGLEVKVMELINEAKNVAVEKINLAEKFGLFSEQWSPKIVADLNDSYIKLAKIEGEFVWHKHDNEDELFVIVKGKLRMQFRDGDVIVEPGEILVVPKGVEHCPIALEETHIILIEPKGTKHTGTTETERTVAVEQQARI